MLIFAEKHFDSSKQRLEDTLQSRSSGDSSDSCSNLVNTSSNPQAGPSSLSFYEPNEANSMLTNVTYATAATNDGQVDPRLNPNTPEYRANELATDQSIDALDTPDGASYSTDSYSENSEEEEDDLSSEEDTNDDTNRIRLQLPSEANNVLAPNALHFNSHSSAHSGTPLAAHHHVNYNALYGVATPASHQIMMNSCPVTQYSANLSQNLSYATVSLMSHNSRIQGDHEYLSLNQSQSTSAQQQLHPNISSSVVVAASTSQSTSLASNNNNNNSHNSHNHNLSNHNLSNHHLNLNVDNSSSSSSNSNSGGGNNNCNSDGQSGGQLHHSQISNNASSEDTFVSEPSPMTGNCSMSR